MTEEAVYWDECGDEILEGERRYDYGLHGEPILHDTTKSNAFIRTGNKADKEILETLCGYCHDVWLKEPLGNNNGREHIPHEHREVDNSRTMSSMDVDWGDSE